MEFHHRSASIWRNASFLNFTDGDKKNFKTLEISKKVGSPHIFDATTSNPQWSEIQRELKGQSAQECLDIFTRVFRKKLKHMMREITGNNVSENVWLTCVL